MGTGGKRVGRERKCVGKSVEGDARAETWETAGGTEEKQQAWKEVNGGLGDGNRAVKLSCGSHLVSRGNDLWGTARQEIEEGCAVAEGSKARWKRKSRWKSEGHDRGRGFLPNVERLAGEKRAS
ncbi:hypothetical protein CLOM_g14925 [Closterium sp. NIES-68]|nr:hypothetical protein CLOM_g14925 [Closterium sp. NIES-68]GJP80296.1 hypothetical protein CLOP_g10523 [Closterium sp. NIES-67]